jgi:hypothetical protein
MELAARHWSAKHHKAVSGINLISLIERAQARSRRAWRTHIWLCLQAFLMLESHCHHRGISLV